MAVQLLYLQRQKPHRLISHATTVQL